MPLKPRLCGKKKLFLKSKYMLSYNKKTFKEQKKIFYYRYKREYSTADTKIVEYNYKKTDDSKTSIW